MYDAFPELPALYDTVPLYVNRHDVQVYMDEARSAPGSVLSTSLLPKNNWASSIRPRDTSRREDGWSSTCAERITAVGT